MACIGVSASVAAVLKIKSLDLAQCVTTDARGHGETYHASHRRIEHPLRNLERPCCTGRFETTIENRAAYSPGRSTEPQCLTLPRMPGITDLLGVGAMCVSLLSCITRSGLTIASAACRPHVQVEAQNSRKRLFETLCMMGCERPLAVEGILIHPQVPIDTNHLERALRAILMDKESRLFRWTNVGAGHVGIIQSPIGTYWLHHIDPYTYLLDVQQRGGRWPAYRVAELIPRVSKPNFAGKLLQSGLHGPPD